MIEFLTPREKEVLGLISQGFSNKEIAQKFCISIYTVRMHIANIYEKLGLSCETSEKLTLRVRAVKIYTEEMKED